MTAQATRQTAIKGKLLAIILAVSVVMLTGCASVPGPGNEKDPLESYNRAMFSFNDSVDKAIIKPVAEAYRDNIPQPVQSGVTNFFSNIDDVFVMINNLLQFKITHALQDFSRIVFNTTFGLGGLIDVSTHMDIPKHNEDFGQTLATWGVADGPYFVLPILGPSTFRDTAGLLVQEPYHPINEIDDDNTRIGATVLRAVDTRARLLGATSIVEEAALDKYSFVRDAYLQHRLNLVHDGNPPRPERDKDVNLESSKEDLELELELEKELQSTPSR